MRRYDHVHDEVRALRRSVVLSRPTSTLIRTTDAAALERALPSDVWLRDGQIRPTVLLGPDGTVVADVWLACDGDDFLVLADGLDATALIAALGTGEPLPHRLVGLDGPFAWAVLGAWDEAGAVGLPYLTLYDRDGVRVLRMGRTGEYGYTFLAPPDQAEDLARTLLALGGRFGIREASADALGYAALETGFLDLAALPRPLTPSELQLQWRVNRDLPASPRRVTAFRAAGARSVGEAVRCDGDVVGEILVAAPDVAGPGAIGLALLDRDLAVAGLGYDAASGPIRTVSLPMIANRSLYVRPQRHTWADEPTLPYPYPA
jgi:aminomethyltransferase